jgi:hypothetical protein
MSYAHTSALCVRKAIKQTSLGVRLASDQRSLRRLDRNHIQNETQTLFDNGAFDISRELRAATVSRRQFLQPDKTNFAAGA